VEGSFADAANNHGFKRARWRRLWRVQIQDWLISGIQNIKILLKPRQQPALSGAQSQVIPFPGGKRPPGRPFCSSVSLRGAYHTPRGLEIIHGIN
jgi:hypothetical protein